MASSCCLGIGGLDTILLNILPALFAIHLKLIWISYDVFNIPELWGLFIWNMVNIQLCVIMFARDFQLHAEIRNVYIVQLTIVQPIFSVYIRMIYNTMLHTLESIYTSESILYKSISLIFDSLGESLSFPAYSWHYLTTGNTTIYPGAISIQSCLLTKRRNAIRKIIW